MNNEKRFECDVVVMPGAELDTDICITGNVYMEKVVMQMATILTLVKVFLPIMQISLMCMLAKIFQLLALSEMMSE